VNGNGETAKRAVAATAVRNSPIAIRLARARTRHENFSLVIAGLDPAIYAATPLIQLRRMACEIAFQHGPPGHRRAKRRRSSNGYAGGDDAREHSVNAK
jgi:hypothetical protein